MALTSHTFASIDDLRAMQAAVTRSWLTPRRPLVSCTPGDLAWWFARGEPGVDWGERIRVWTDGAVTVGWGWLSKPAELEWFVAADVDEADERRLRIEILDWARARVADDAPIRGRRAAGSRGLGRRRLARAGHRRGSRGSRRPPPG